MVEPLEKCQSRRDIKLHWHYKRFVSRYYMICSCCWSEWFSLHFALSPGREVVKLSYEAYDSMALKQMRVVAAEMRQQWDLLGIVMIHRLGYDPRWLFNCSPFCRLRT